MMRSIGMDVHRSFAQVAIHDDGAIPNFVTVGHRPDIPSRFVHLIGHVVIAPVAAVVDTIGGEVFPGIPAF